MNRQRLTSVVVVIVFVLAISAPGAQTASVPRKSPELTISVPLGKTTLLSSYKGKVVVVEFLFIASEHCMHFAQVLNKLNRELGPGGFQPVGIVFDPPKVPTSAEKVIPSLVDYFKITYPVGFASKADVDTYLGRTGNELLAIPQVVVIDRAGVIRAMTGNHTNPKLEDENSLRTLIEGLLKEAASAKNSHTLETSLAVGDPRTKTYARFCIPAKILSVSRQSVSAKNYWPGRMELYGDDERGAFGDHEYLRAIAFACSSLNPLLVQAALVLSTRVSASPERLRRPRESLS